MDIAFWQAIKEKNFAIPPGYSVEFLIEYLLTALGNTNPEIREGPNHEVLENWIHRGAYSADGTTDLFVRITPTGRLLSVLSALMVTDIL